MADFYVDNVNGASGNSGASELLPKQLLSQASFSANNRVFCKREQTHPVSTYRFLQSGMTLTAYGTGRKPVIQKTAGNDAWIYVQNASKISLSDFDADGNGFNGSVISLSASTGHSISAVTVKNVEVYGAPNNVGLILQGNSGGAVRIRIEIVDCRFRNNFSHGTQCATDVQGVVYRRCIARRNGTGVGAHGFTAYSASGTAPTGIRWVHCEATGTIDFDGIEGTGIQADDNTSNCVAIGCFVHDNQGAGISFNGSTGHSMVGCLSVRNRKAGLYLSNSATNCKAYHNTITGNCLGGVFTGEVVSNTNSTGFTSKNNIILNSGAVSNGIALSAGSASGSTSESDCIYGFSTATQNITATSTITSDPLLDASWRLKTGSPCIGVGARAAGARHMGGLRPRMPADVGAYRYAPSRSMSIARPFAS